jgi:glycosyltransferase involved in cell wall biosynthesis
MQSWSFGILCVNEAGSLPSVYRQVCDLISAWDLQDAEILLVDDGSTDGTGDLIRELASGDDRIKMVIHPHNQGIGAGIRSIYFNAGKDNVVFIPGDGQFDVGELKPFREFPPSTYIAFYREENQTYNAFRNTLSWLNKAFNHLLLGLQLRDVNWVKVYKREMLPGMRLRLQSSAIESEICAKLAILGVRPTEVRSRYLPRRYGASKGASLRSIFRVLRELVKLFAAVTVFRFTKKKVRL